MQCSLSRFASIIESVLSVFQIPSKLRPNLTYITSGEEQRSCTRKESNGEFLPVSLQSVGVYFDETSAVDEDLWTHLAIRYQLRSVFKSTQFVVLLQRLLVPNKTVNGKNYFFFL